MGDALLSNGRFISSAHKWGLLDAVLHSAIPHLEDLASLRTSVVERKIFKYKVINRPSRNFHIFQDVKVVDLCHPRCVTDHCSILYSTAIFVNGEKVFFLQILYFGLDGVKEKLFDF